MKRKEKKKEKEKNVLQLRRSEIAILTVAIVGKRNFGKQLVQIGKALFVKIVTRLCPTADKLFGKDGAKLIIAFLSND